MKITKTFRGLLTVLTLGAALGLGGCDGALGPDDRDPVTPEDADAIAGFVSDMDFLSLGIMTLTAASGGRSISRTAPCPAGGSVSVSGSSESSTNEQTKVVSRKWATTQTHAACAITHTRGDKTATAVVDGSVTTSGTSSYQLPASRGGLPTLLSWASATAGSTTTKVGDRTRTCAVDVKQTYDPVAKTFTISGVMCGRQVNITRGLGR
ncbi:MAG: hypothetical protein Q8N53_21275 [Longimicrobiales bacterium]|nr:hypothetical protein [Longimicrobiales bacterium]